MKKIFALALLGAMSMGAFASDNKPKSKKNKKGAKTEQCCATACDKPCKPKPACCKI